MGGGFSKKPDDELENVVPSPGPVKAGHGHYGEGHGDTGFRPEAMPGSPRYTLAGGKPVSDEVVLDRFGGNMYELLKNEATLCGASSGSGGGAKDKDKEAPAPPIIQARTMTALLGVREALCRELDVSKALSDYDKQLKDYGPLCDRSSSSFILFFSRVRFFSHQVNFTSGSGVTWPTTSSRTPSWRKASPT